MRLGAPLVLAAIAAVLVLALWFTLRSASEINSTAKRHDALAEKEVDRAPALRAPHAHVRRDDSAGTDANDVEGTSTPLDPGDLVVRILDVQGTPVDDLLLGLELVLTRPEDHDVTRRRLSVWAAEGDVERHGIRIPFETLERAFLMARQAQAKGLSIGVSLAPAFTIPACTSYTFRELEKPAEDIELRLEGSGFVRVEAMEPSGEPCVHDLDVLVMIVQSSSESNRPEESTTPHQWNVLSVEDPRVRVPLGQFLFVELKDQRELFQFHRETIASPTIEGGEVLLRLKLRPYPCFVGRLISLNGEPMRDHEYTASIRSISSNTEWTSGRTDAEGRFRVEVILEPPPRKIAELSICPFASDQRRFNEKEREKLPQARIVNLDVPEYGQRDLGDVRLTPSEFKFLASGVVVDGDGKPVADAQVSAEHVWPPTDQGPWEEWESLSDAWTSTNARGEFQILSRKPCRALRLGATRQGHYLENYVTMELGRTDALLVLRPGADIAGSVLLPEGISPREITMERYLEKGNSQWQDLDKDGGFRFKGCKPGVHSLRVLSHPWTLLEIPEVIVGTQQGPLDPRLQKIDLRSRLTLLRLRVLDSSGVPLQEQSVEFSMVDDAECAGGTDTDATGLALIVMPVEVEALAVCIDGGMPQVVRWSPEVQEVRLLEPIEVELTLEPPQALPEGIYLKAILTLTSEPPPGVDPKLLLKGWCEFYTAKEVGYVPVPGTYRITWRVSTNRRELFFESGAAQEIKVLAGDGVQRIKIAMPLDSYRAAIQKLGR